VTRRGILSVSPSSARGANDPTLRARLFESGCENVLGPFALRNRDDRSTEAAARHPRADRARLYRRVDDVVECRRRDLVVVTQAGVARREELAKCVQVLHFECVDRGPDALVLRLDVPDAPRVAGLELASTIGVARALVHMPLAGIDDDDRQLFRQLDPAMLERSAVEQQRTPLASEQ
jgi:hypothetical protein